MQNREVVTTHRDVDGRLVPSGEPVTIPANSFVTLTQALGGSFSVVYNGNMARIEGKDADAIGKEVPKSEFEAPDDGTINEDQVWEALSRCYDPEIPVNVVDLGLIYDCKVWSDSEGSHVYVLMTLTAPGCGMGPVIADDVKRACESVPNVDDVEVELTFSPAWSSEMLTDEAKLELGIL